MRKRSLIYEEIINFLIEQKLINNSFYANQIDLSRRKTVVSFIYKHSNITHKQIWTLFFIRVPNSKPIKFKVDFECLKEYEMRFGLSLIILKSIN
jgi:hypothetical protein